MSTPQERDVPVFVRAMRLGLSLDYGKPGDQHEGYPIHLTFDKVLDSNVVDRPVSSQKDHIIILTSLLYLIKIWIQLDSSNNLP